jgi:methionyl-tRNA formyltransferase
MALKTIFMGTPEFAVPTLESVAAEHEVVAVYTQPPRPAGRRGLELTRSPVHRKADELGVRVHTPRTLKTPQEQAAFRALGADIAVVVAYGLLLPRPILGGTLLGCYNAHASLLPRWRGAAPIQRAIQAGDEETGMMIMRMDEGLDTGPVALTQRVPIDHTMTAGELNDRLRVVGAELMARALRKLEHGTLLLTAQSETGATYAKKVDKAETRVDWARPALEVHNKVRGFSPSPGAWCEMEFAGKSERVKLLRTALANGSGEPGEVMDDQLAIACGQGAVRLVELQRAGSRALDAAAFLRGTKLSAGARFK